MDVVSARCSSAACWGSRRLLKAALSRGVLTEHRSFLEPVPQSVPCLPVVCERAEAFVVRTTKVVRCNALRRYTRERLRELRAALGWQLRTAGSSATCPSPSSGFKSIFREAPLGCTSATSRLDLG